MGRELILPKNIRQIGDIQGKEKIFLEDYVMTYIKKKEKQEKEGYLGIFLGERQEKEDTVYVFVRGILEVPADMLLQSEEAGAKGKREEILKKSSNEEAVEKKSSVEDDESKNTSAQTGGNKKASCKCAKEENWMDKMEKEYQEYFPDLAVQGCCVIGVYPTERMRQLSDVLPEAGGLIYHLQEQEETIYRVENGRYRQIKGYFVFYEQNRKMQEYMASVFSNDRVEKEGVSDKAIRSFRKKVKEKGLQKNTSFLKLASSFFVVTVLVIGAIVVNRIEDIRAVRTVVDSGDTTVENEVVRVEDAAVVSEDLMNDTVNSYATEADAASLRDAAGDSGISVSSSLIDQEITQELAGSDSFWNDTALEDGDVAGSEAASGEIQDSAEVLSIQSGQADIQVTQTANQNNQADIQVSDQNEQADIQVSNQNNQADIQVSNQNEQTDVQSQQETDQNEATETQAAQEVAAIRQTQAAYVIKEGDTLADICNRYYGNMERLTEICEANGITDANMIMPGQKIVLP